MIALADQTRHCTTTGGGEPSGAIYDPLVFDPYASTVFAYMAQLLADHFRAPHASVLAAMSDLDAKQEAETGDMWLERHPADPKCWPFVARATWIQIEVLTGVRYPARPFAVTHH